MSWTAYLLLSVLSLYPGLVSIISGQVQRGDAIRKIQGVVEQCPSVEERERAKNELYHFVASVVANTTLAPTMPTMTTTYTCNGTPGWRRVVFINMTDTSYNCPTGLNLTSYSKRTCGRSHTAAGCSSTTFSVGGFSYSRVCGRIRGYQWGATSAFWAYAQGIDSYYVEGVSLTHGGVGRRQHIWTFAAGVTELANDFPSSSCPCDTGNYNHVPAFVGNDFFCESGFHFSWSYQFILFPDDILWDGENCISTSTCCQFNNPPWFTKNLPTATTDDIELRLCTDFTSGGEDIPIELIELYMQ